MTTNRATRLLVLLFTGLVAAAGMCVHPAVAADLTLTTGGRVSIELLFSDALFHNTLAIASPSVGVAITGCKLEPAAGLTGVSILSEKISQRGCRVDLDADPGTAGIQPFAVGTTFKFNFCAQTDADADCDFIWASDPASNSDGDDHVITTPVRAAEFPGQIFQLAWEDLENLGDADFDDLIATFRVNIDADGDGLWDDWEQFGIDTDGDGAIDLDLPGLGADPRHMDVFLEIDWMDCAVAGGDCAVGDTHSHRPTAAAVNAVVQAFDAAPMILNPDGLPGIDLHVDLSNAVAHQNLLIIPNACFTGAAGTGFDAVKNDPANFGPANPRRFAYHYQLWTHGMQSSCSFSGCAELPGNDSQISLGGWNFVCVGGMNAGRGCCSGLQCPGGACQPGGDLDGDGVADTHVGTVAQQAGTMIHEFGHNLNLGHGGIDWANNKPNYLSAMNYTFQLSGIPPTDPDGAGGPLAGRVDFSGQALPTLVENNLSEPAGIGDGTDTTFFFCPGASRPSQPGAGMGPIDWDCDSDGGVEVGVSSDINGDAGVPCVGPGANGVLDTVPAVDDVIVSTRMFEGPNRQCDTLPAADDVQFRPLGPLVGFDDWHNLKFDFQNTADFEDGAHTFQEIQLTELDYTTFSEQLAADPMVAKVASPDPVLTGSDVTYTIVVKNSGPSGARDVTMTDDLPAETTFISCFATGMGVCAGSGNNRVVTFASLPGGESETVTLVARANCPVPDGTVIANTATVASVTQDSDPLNNTAIAAVTASNPPPAISDVAVDKPVLWPPNHKLNVVTVTYTVTDNCGPVTCNLDVVSDEPPDGLGDGDKAPDAEVIDGNHVRLRSERSGRGDGRIYAIKITCSDSSGASASKTTTVTVPHDRSGVRGK